MADIRYWDDALAEALEEVRGILTKRHKSYGAQNILRGGMPGIVLRLGDKMAKLGRWRSQSQEEIEDHFIDLAGYGLLGMLLLKGQMALPLKGEEEGEVRGFE